ncbi:MAG: EamA family transporter [Ichthyobacteriaceae bacterium]|nr:EamA family transporter [Ichthyobacteriaceae bacterium]
MKYSFLVFLGAASYGILSTIAKFSYEAGFSAFDATGSQMIFGTIILWAMVLLTSKKDKGNKLSAKSIVATMLMGIPIGITSFSYYQAVQLMPASLAILLLFQFTWIGVLFEAISTKQLPNKFKIISSLVLMFGTVLAAGILEHGLNNFSLKGFVFGIVSAFSYALFIFFSGKSGDENIRPLKKSALMVTGAMILTSLLHPPMFLVNGALYEGLIPYGVLLAIFGAVLPPLLFSIGIPRIGVGLSSIISAAELPVAVVASSFLLHEDVTALQWLGVLVILSGMILPNIIAKKRNVVLV